MNRIATTLALAAGISCAAFGYEPPRHNDTFTTNGITYAQRGGLGASDYVVTNIDANAVGKVKSVNGQTGDVTLGAQDVGAVARDANYLSVSNSASRIEYVELDDFWYGWYFNGLSQYASSAHSLSDDSTGTRVISDPSHTTDRWGVKKSNTFNKFAYVSEIPNVPAWALESHKPSYTASEVGAIPTTGGVFNASLHLNNKLSVGTWTSSVSPYDISGGSGIAFVFGDNVHTKRSNTMTLGVGALNTNEWSFVWNGDPNRMYFPTIPSMSNPYSSRYNGGFHANPSVRDGMTNPLQNFWIGDTNLATWVTTLALGKTGEQTIVGESSDHPYFKIGFDATWPWLEFGESIATNRAYSPHGSGTLALLSDIPPTVSNVVTKTYVESLGITLAETDPTVPQWAKASAKPTYSASEVGALSSAGGTLVGDLTVESTGDKSEISVEHGNEYVALRVKDNKATIETSDYTYAMPHGDGTIALTKNIPDVPAWALAAQKPTYTASEVGATSPTAVSNIVTTAYVREKLGVYLYVGEDGGIYVHTNEE